MQPCSIVDVKADLQCIGYSFIDAFSGKKRTVIQLFTPHDENWRGGIFNGHIVVDADAITDFTPIPFI